MLKVCLRIVCNYACLHTEALLCVKVWKPFVAWGWEGKTERTNFKQLQRHKDWWQAGASVMSADLGNFILGICFHVCAMDLSGQTVSASNVSTSKITSRALCDFFFFYPKFIQPGFSWGLCGFSMTLVHLHEFHLIQLILNITLTSKVSYIPNLYSENIWRTEFNLDKLKRHFMKIIC